MLEHLREKIVRAIQAIEQDPSYKKRRDRLYQAVGTVTAEDLRKQYKT